MNTQPIFAVCCLAVLWSPAAAQPVPPEIRAKLDARARQLQAIASDAVLVAAVREHNAKPSAEARAMTNEKWKTLSILDPFVRSFGKNAAGLFLKSKKDESVSEMFASGADGAKVAFLTKPSGWSHKGKEKHDVPMTGRVWIGPVETDESSGMQQVQVALPVVDGGRPIGSLVVGVKLSSLK